MTRGVRVNAPIYTEIGRVTATDADAEADMIKYKLENVTFVRPSTGYRRQLGASAFLVDPLTGVIQTNQSYGRYSDGYFDVVIKAHNSPDPSRMDLTFMKVFVLQDTDLMKFVFDKNPVNVAKEMREFKEEVEAALAQPLTLNVYDNEFYSKVDGSLDFGRTSSCFQVGKNNFHGWQTIILLFRYLIATRTWWTWTRSTGCLTTGGTENWRPYSPSTPSTAWRDALRSELLPRWTGSRFSFSSSLSSSEWQPS